MKKRLIILSMLFIFALVLTACGKKSEEADNQSDIKETEDKDEDKSIETDREAAEETKKKLPYKEEDVISEGPLYDAMIGIRDGNFEDVYNAMTTSSRAKPDQRSFEIALRDNLSTITSDMIGELENYRSDSYETVVTEDGYDVTMYIIENNNEVDKLILPINADGDLIIKELLVEELVFHFPIKMNFKLNGTSIETEPLKEGSGYKYTVSDILVGDYTIVFEDTILEVPEAGSGLAINKGNTSFNFASIIGKEEGASLTLKEDINIKRQDAHGALFESAVEALNLPEEERVAALDSEHNTLTDNQKDIFIKDFYNQVTSNVSGNAKNFIISEKGGLTNHGLTFISNDEFTRGQTVDVKLSGLIDYTRTAQYIVTYQIDENGNIKVIDIIPA